MRSVHACWHILVAAAPLADVAFHARLLTFWSSVSLWSRFSSRAIVPFEPDWASWSRHPHSPYGSWQTCSSRRNGHTPGPRPRRIQRLQGKDRGSPSGTTGCRHSTSTPLGPVVLQKMGVHVPILQVREKACQSWRQSQASTCLTFHAVHLLMPQGHSI